MNLYEVNAGASYWIGSDTPEQALALAREQEVVANGETEAAESMAGVEAKELGESAARSVMVNDDSDGQMRSLWEIVQRDAQPGIIACSEWG